MFPDEKGEVKTRFFYVSHKDRALAAFNQKGNKVKVLSQFAFESAFSLFSTQKKLEKDRKQRKARAHTKLSYVPH